MMHFCGGMTQLFTNITLDGLGEVATFLKGLTQKQNVVLFYGHMGAGKTTFIKTFCRELGVRDEVSSPTFSLVNEYQSSDGKPVYHFDFYRLEDVEEAYDMGYEEYVYSTNVCLIEWPQKIDGLLPDEVISFTIEGVGDTRNIKIEY